MIIVKLQIIPSLQYENPPDPDPLLSALQHLSVLFTLNSFILSSFFSAFYLTALKGTVTLLLLSVLLSLFWDSLTLFSSQWKHRISSSAAISQMPETNRIRIIIILLSMICWISLRKMKSWPTLFLTVLPLILLIPPLLPSSTAVIPLFPVKMAISMVT